GDVVPSRRFSLEMISALLRDIGVDDAPTLELLLRVGRALAGRADEDIIEGLPGLDQVQGELAQRWLGDVGRLARQVLEADDHLSGDPDLVLGIERQGQLIRDLLAGPAAAPAPGGAGLEGARRGVVPGAL